jgi:hypothetical protein
VNNAVRPVEGWLAQIEDVAAYVLQTKERVDIVSRTVARSELWAFVRF